MQVVRGLALDLEPQARRLIGEIGDWLGRQSVRPRAPTLLHSDFKLDNMIVEPVTLAPVAVVDWDMGTRGDPLFDLATLLSYWAEEADPACMHDMKQLPTAAPGATSELCSRCAASGSRRSQCCSRPSRQTR